MGNSNMAGKERNKRPLFSDVVAVLVDSRLPLYKSEPRKRRADHAKYMWLAGSSEAFHFFSRLACRKSCLVQWPRTFILQGITVKIQFRRTSGSNTSFNKKPKLLRLLRLHWSLNKGKKLVGSAEPTEKPRRKGEVAIVAKNSV